MREAGEQYVRIGYECDFLQTVFKVSLFYFFFYFAFSFSFSVTLCPRFFCSVCLSMDGVWWWFVGWIFFWSVEDVMPGIRSAENESPNKNSHITTRLRKRRKRLSRCTKLPNNQPTNRSTNIQQQLHLQISCIRFSHGFQHFSFIGKMFEFSMHNSWHDSVDGSGYFLAYTHIKLMRIRWKNMKKRVAAATVVVVADSMLKNKKHAVRQYSL